MKIMRRLPPFGSGKLIPPPRSKHHSNGNSRNLLGPALGKLSADAGLPSPLASSTPSRRANPFFTFAFLIAGGREPWPDADRFGPRMSRSFFARADDKSSPPANEAVQQPPSPALPPDAPKEDISIVPKDLLEVASSTVNSLREGATASIAWVKETTNSVLPVLRERLDLPEYSSETVTQLVYTTIAAVLAWFVMPSVFRMIHRYSEDGSYLLLRRTEKIPYELSFWAALEDPARSLITVVAFIQLGSLIAPTTIASAHLGQVWKGTAVVALVWFLHRWKSNFLSRILANPNLATAERERILTVDKISAMALFILGGMGVAETCGIAAQSILTVGGIGGVATAFAARDILGNVLSGFSLQFLRPFAIGDIIKAGAIEGQVVDIGLTSTQLLDNEKFPVTVPNSYFSSQVIVNKSRASWRAFSVKVPVHLKDFEKLPQITLDVKNMLKSHSRVVIHHGLPHCYVSRVTGTSLEISALCNIAIVGKDDLLSTEQDITLQILKIITEGGATVGAQA